MTTRYKRPGEKEGIDYFFVDVDTFKKKIEQGELLEYAQFVGNYYGTPKAYVDQLLDEGKNVVWVALCESHRFFTGHKVLGREDHVVQRLEYVMDDLFPVTVKGFVVQVRMGIEEPHHFTRLPAGMSTKGTLRLPSFDAARIIPCDSIPMSFAGFRFDTKMTCLPMSSSG